MFMRCWKFLGVLGCLGALLLASCGGEGNYQLDQGERDALISMYNKTGGGNHWRHNDNWEYWDSEVDSDGDTTNTLVKFAPPECEWYGVTCDAANEHVVAIDLHDNNLTGQLPLLTALTQLQSVNVSGNPNLDVSLWTAGGMPSSVIFIH